MSETLYDRLYQDTYWVDAAGRKTRLDYMTGRHRANLRRWLRRNAAAMKDSLEASFLSWPGPTGEVAAEDYERDFSRLLEQTSVRWLMETDFYRRLIVLCWRDRSAA